MDAQTQAFRFRRDRLTGLRAKRRWSIGELQRQLARIGHSCTVESIRCWELGRVANPNQRHIMALAQLFEVEPTFFYSPT